MKASLLVEVHASVVNATARVRLKDDITACLILSYILGIISCDKAFLVRS